MSYTPTTWTTGDTITASAMNKIEQGIANAGSALICTMSYSSSLDQHVLDKTVQEIYDALLGGTPVYIKYQYGVLTEDFIGTLYLAPVVKIYNYDYTGVIRIHAIRPYTVDNNISGKYYTGIPSLITFSASSLNAYPQFDSSTTVSSNSVSVNSAVL